MQRVINSTGALHFICKFAFIIQNSQSLRDGFKRHPGFRHIKLFLKCFRTYENHFYLQTAKNSPRMISALYFNL